MRSKTWLMIGLIAVFSFGALADDGHRDGNDNNSSFQSSVIGSVPGMAIGGVNSAGAPWVVSEGQASVSSNGRIRVEVKGLLIGPGGPPAAVGTVGSVTMVAASLVCGGTGGTAIPVADGAVTPSPLSAAGNAEIDQMVTIPAMCFGPVVVRIFNAGAQPQVGSFIAVTGLTPGAGQNEQEDSHGGRGRGL